MRELRTIGRPVDVEVEVFENCKYTAQSLNDLGFTVKAEYENVINWEIVTGEDAEQIEAETDESCIDELHEYLVLHFVDGGTNTFRNSHVDMFIIKSH